MYKLKLTPERFKSLGFRYDVIGECYTYEFPVYKYKNQTIITCRLWVNNESKELTYVVQDSDKKIYAAYYNREYGGVNYVILKIEENIKKEFKRLGVRKIK